MRTVGIIKELRMQAKDTKTNLVLYFVSVCLWGGIVFFNLVKLFYNPTFQNGIILEIGIISFIGCGYLFIINRKRLETLKEKELEIRIVKRVRKSYV